MTSIEAMRNATSNMLEAIGGENPMRPGLRDTPKRVSLMYRELLSGYDEHPANILTEFENEGFDQIILLRDIELYSLCEHHMLPFLGKAHVAYIPNDHKIVGISKLARLVDIYARRLQIQERLGTQIVDALEHYLKPVGAACIIEAEHLCMRMRGVGKQNSVMVTSALRGVFMRQDSFGLAAREELMRLIRG